ncbi:Ras association domain-containing protein 8 [Toxocara canis]|uniref:Ras association domain-containing protein 8 n=1 Tax=Toxocara canis TaxID=6265 RepID=A0A0B2VX51_TOXCA|nr:Ras association domain-containing protein 8 [Toxocara canis]
MELKVNVDGVERSVSGLTETTTCAQIIYALAHATGQKGRFVLVEKYRNAERSLAPTDRPLEMLRKWDQHSQHVRFVLKHLEGSTPTCAAGDPKSSDAEHLCTSAAAQSSNSAHKMALPVRCSKTQFILLCCSSTRKLYACVLTPYTHIVSSGISQLQKFSIFQRDFVKVGLVDFCLGKFSSILFSSCL